MFFSLFGKCNPSNTKVLICRFAKASVDELQRSFSFPCLQSWHSETEIRKWVMYIVRRFYHTAADPLEHRLSDASQTELDDKIC
jgi:hypothetical protein